MGNIDLRDTRSIIIREFQPVDKEALAGMCRSLSEGSSHRLISSYAEDILGRIEGVMGGRIFMILKDIEVSWQWSVCF